MRVPVLAAAALLLLAGCSSSSQKSAEPSATPSPAASPTTTSPTAAPTGPSTPSPTPTFVVSVVSPSPGAFTLSNFQTPSHNVKCSLAREEDGRAWVRCDVYQHTWGIPPKPADCDLDWGSVATLANDGKPGKMGACVSDAAGGDTVLAYGHALRLADLECRSSTAGLECLALARNHGFFVSRASYRVW